MYNNPYYLLINVLKGVNIWENYLEIYLVIKKSEARANVVIGTLAGLLLGTAAGLLLARNQVKKLVKISPD